MARRPPGAQRTFGYRGAEVIGALGSVTALVMIGLYLVHEAVVRFLAPREVGGWVVPAAIIAAASLSRGIRRER